MESCVFTPADPVGKLRWLAKVLADPALSTAARAIAAALVVRHNSKSGRLDPGAGDLAELAGLSVRGAQLARDRLVAGGYLEKERRRAGAKGQWNRTNAYRLAGLERSGAGEGRGAAGGRAVTSRGGRAVTSPEPLNLEPLNEQAKAISGEGEGGPGGAAAAELVEAGPGAGDQAPAWRRMREVLARKAAGSSWWRGFGSRLEGAALEAGVLTVRAPSSFVADFARREEWRLRDAALAAGLAAREVRIVVAAAGG
jgi:hypothetical protein